ncbi:RebB family R body protein [Marinomonas sp.]|uniref:RebB family R body protein n=1 Tax=Marinomonas sp. TaxID=1904862 RepID=UPI003BA8DAE0
MSQLIKNTVADMALLTVGLSSVNSAVNLINSVSTSISLSMLNAVANQQAGSLTRQTVSAQSNSGIMSTGSAVQSAVTENIL